MLLITTSALAPPQALVEARGDLDVFGALHLRRAIKAVVAAGCGTVNIDLTGLRFADWAGLRVVARALDDLRADAADPHVHGVSHRTAAVAAMAGESGDFAASPSFA